VRGGHMRCYKCGSFLTDGDTCPQCGENVRIYKKTARVSDAYYNAGLYKARVRDLTGAVESLKISLMINKYNTNARNLLGLVYCEMGDVVEALSQWVVSKNFTPEGNIAGHYIKKIQTNQNRFEMITGTIRKYNLSLKYAKEGNLDMAVIQLKKVVANNPQLIKAHLLLALIYIKQDELSRAKKLLNAVLAIDKNNTLAHIYQKEIAERNVAKKAETSGSFLPKRKEKDIDKKPLSGNDVILPRSSYKEPSNGAITIINVLAGVVIGAALIWFLIVPARNKGLTQDYKKSLQEYSEQLSSGNVELNSMQKELEEVKAQKDALEQQLGVVNGTEGSNKLLVSVIEAASDYIANKPDDAANKLVDIDVSALPSESAKTLYNTIATATLPAAAQTHEPVRQGLVSMTGTFIDTIVICTLTGLSIVLTGAWQVDGLEGVQVTTYAFQNGLPFPHVVSSFVLMMCLVFFAFTTILGWDYYSERCLEYLTGGNMKKVMVFRWIYILAVFIGPYMTVSAVWTIADIFNGLMALPNMIALFALNGVVVYETKKFFEAGKHKK